MHGDFGRARITVGFKVTPEHQSSSCDLCNHILYQVIYANKAARLIILRCRHSAQDLLSSCLPLIDKVEGHLEKVKPHLSAFEGEKRCCCCKVNLHRRYHKVGWLIKQQTIKK